MLHLVRSTHRVRFQCDALLKGAFAIPTRVNLVRKEVAHIQTHSAINSAVSANVARLSVNSRLSLRLKPGESLPASPCSMPPEARTSSAEPGQAHPAAANSALSASRVPSLDPLIVTVSVALAQHLENSGRALPQLVPDSTRMASNDVSSCSSCSSDHAATSTCSTAPAAPVGVIATSLAVARPICTRCAIAQASGSLPSTSRSNPRKMTLCATSTHLALTSISSFTWVSAGQTPKA